jgi:hypothetical protein
MQNNLHKHIHTSEYNKVLCSHCSNNTVLYRTTKNIYHFTDPALVSAVESHLKDKHKITQCKHCGDFVPSHKHEQHRASARCKKSRQASSVVSAGYITADVYVSMFDQWFTAKLFQLLKNCVYDDQDEIDYLEREYESSFKNFLSKLEIVRIVKPTSQGASKNNMFSWFIPADKAEFLEAVAKAIPFATKSKWSTPGWGSYSCKLNADQMHAISSYALGTEDQRKSISTFYIVKATQVI